MGGPCLGAICLHTCFRLLAAQSRQLYGVRTYFTPPSLSSCLQLETSHGAHPCHNVPDPPPRMQDLKHCNPVALGIYHSTLAVGTCTQVGK